MTNQITTLDMGKKFKKTPAGEIPVEWDATNIDSIGELGRGRVINQKEINEHPGPYPVYSSQSKKQGVMGYIDTFDFEGEYVTWTTDGAYAGTVFFRSGRFNCTNVCGTIKANGNHPICAEFLAYILSMYTKRHVSYVGNPKLMNNVMGKIFFPYPPLREQKKIAEILTAVDESIEKTRAVIEKTKELKKALMQTLLTRGIGHKKFKKTPIGEIPVEWEIVRLGNMAEQSDERFMPSILDQRPYIGLEHIGSGDGRILAIGNSKSISSLKTIFYKGDILFGKLRPNLKKVAMAPFDGVCSTDIMVIRPRENLIPAFLYYLLQSDNAFGFAIGTSGGTKMPRTSWPLFRNYEFPCPSLSEQKKIAEILTAVDEKIEKEENARKTMDGLKKGLMQALLTGKVRV
jgi:type I restriction enzyme S subunit